MTECQNAKSKLDLFVFNAEANNLDRTDVFRACLETHLSIMKRFNSMLAMAI